MLCDNTKAIFTNQYDLHQTLMEESNQLTKPNTGDRDQIIPTQNHLISSHSTKRNHFQSQVTRQSLDDTYDISNLPGADSILLEILSRLPLKSVFMFKSVCKHWLTLISHSSFKTFYFSRMHAAHPSFRILYKFTDDSDIEGLLDRLTYSSLDPIYSLYRDPAQNIKFKVIGVSNGLVLCFSRDEDIYYVCDPVTRQRVSLPKRKKTKRGFAGFVTRIDEHNVVTSFTLVLVSYKMKTSKGHLILDIFSSKIGKWSKYRLPCPIYIELWRPSVGPIVFNGILHWFVKDHGMVAFDPYKDPKSCRLIGLPVDRDVESENTHDGLYQLCDGCQGRLQFFQVAPDVGSFYCFSMWVMKDYEKGEWCSEFKVTRSDLSSSDPELNSLLMRARFVPLCFDPLNLDIVYMRCFELSCVVSYSIHNRRLDKLSDVADNSFWSVVVPFVIPRWPTQVPVPPVQDRELDESKDVE